MEALPISTLQPSSPAATAGVDPAADPGVPPTGPEGDFQALLSRNLAGHASRAASAAGAAAMIAADDGKGAVAPGLLPERAAHLCGARSRAGAAALPGAEAGKTAVPAALTCGTGDDAAASTLPAMEDGEADVSMRPSPDFTGSACGPKGPAGGGAEDGKAIEENAQEGPAKDFPAGSESSLPPLAALLQPVAAPENRAASPAPAGRGREGVAGEQAPRTEHAADPIVSGARPGRVGPSESGPTLRFDPDKRPARGAEALADAPPAGTQGAHAALPAGHAPLAPLGVDPAAAGPAQAPAAPRIETPLGAPGWSTALADRVMMFVGDKQQVAELHINPPHLGPVEITLTVSDDRASAVFASPHAVVRETIESSLPRLREVLAESGINLGQASVTADSPRDGFNQAQTRSSFSGGNGGSGGGRAAAENTTLANTLAAVRRARGMVDLFA